MSTYSLADDDEVIVKLNFRNSLTGYITILLIHLFFAIPKLLHTLCNCAFRSPKLMMDYDNLLRSIVDTITNDHFQDHVPAWVQATLPVRLGGLGIRAPLTSWSMISSQYSSISE